MTQGAQQARDDIAYIKTFMGGSGQPPIAVAHVYLLLGIVGALYAFRRFCLDMGWELPSLLIAYTPWDTIGLFLIGFATSSTIMWRQGQGLPDDPQDLNPAARAALSAWGAVTFAVMVGVLSLWLAAESPDTGSLLAPAAILFAVCYSVGWSVTHTVHRVGWHRFVAWGFIVWAGALGAAAGSPWLTLVIAFGLLLLFAAPGYQIIRETGSARQTTDGD